MHTCGHCRGSIPAEKIEDITFVKNEIPYCSRICYDHGQLPLFDLPVGDIPCEDYFVDPPVSSGASSHPDQLPLF